MAFILAFSVLIATSGIIMESCRLTEHPSIERLIVQIQARLTGARAIFFGHHPKSNDQ
jgi:hypothetical protein